MFITGVASGEIQARAVTNAGDTRRAHSPPPQRRLCIRSEALTELIAQGN